MPETVILVSVTTTVAPQMRFGGQDVAVMLETVAFVPVIAFWARMASPPNSPAANAPKIAAPSAQDCALRIENERILLELPVAHGVALADGETA